MCGGGMQGFPVCLLVLPELYNSDVVDWENSCDPQFPLLPPPPWTSEGVLINSRFESKEQNR